MKDNKAVRILFLAALTLAAAVSLFQGARNALQFSQDLQWDAAKALYCGIDPYELSLHPGTAKDIPELEGFYTMFTDKGLSQEMEANQFPSLLVLLFPITAFSPETARAVWLICNILFTAGIVFLLKKTLFNDFSSYAYAAAVLIMLAGTPYRNQLGVGQHTLFAFFFFVLAVYIDMKQPVHPGVSTAATSLCLFVSYFKYTLTGPLALYFVYKRKYKELALSVAGHVIVTFACAQKLGKGFLYMITAPLSVASNLSESGGMDLGAILGSPASYAVAALIVAGLLVIALKLAPGYDELLFGVLILWSLILVYHRTYDFWAMSVAAAVFASPAAAELSARWRNILNAYYWVVVAAVYFALRLFNESTGSMIVTGVMYYIQTLAFTILCIRKIRGRKNEQ